LAEKVAKSPENLGEAGRRLQEIREALGLTRTELAIAIDRSEKTVRAAENGAQALGPRAWARVEQLRRAKQTPYCPSAAPAAVEAREAPPPWATRPPPAGHGSPTPGNGNGCPSLDRVAAIVADTSVQQAAAAMIGAGIAPATAWRAIIEAKLRETKP